VERKRVTTPFSKSQPLGNGPLPPAWCRRSAKIQILTIRELFEGKQPNIPLVDASAFKKAAKEKVGNQDALRF
jgi:hypothetical protein